MKKIHFEIHVNASPEKVWEAMLAPASYKQWVDTAWPGSYYDGEWKEGQEMKFLSPAGAGTLALLEKVAPYQSICARHVAIIHADGSVDRSSAATKNWTGTTETYKFLKDGTGTRLVTEMEIYPEWEAMFSGGWPTALAKLKEISEQ